MNEPNEMNQINPHNYGLSLIAKIENTYKQFAKELLEYRKLMERPLEILEVEDALNQLSEEINRIKLELKIDELKQNMEVRNEE